MYDHENAGTGWAVPTRRRPARSCHLKAKKWRGRALGRRYHDDVLIDQLAEALTDVWRRVALPLEGCVIDAAQTL